MVSNSNMSLPLSDYPGREEAKREIKPSTTRQLSQPNGVGDIIDEESSINHSEIQIEPKLYQRYIRRSKRPLFNQKLADLQLLIECEHQQMIPFVRYVLGKAVKYRLDVHILLECIKNSTESQLLSKYGQIKEFLAKSVKGFE
jgi:hypothetical protein